MEKILLAHTVLLSRSTPNPEKTGLPSTRVAWGKGLDLASIIIMAPNLSSYKKDKFLQYIKYKV